MRDIHRYTLTLGHTTLAQHAKIHLFLPLAAAAATFPLLHPLRPHAHSVHHALRAQLYGKTARRHHGGRQQRQRLLHAHVAGGTR